ncbi:hypothetical protein [Rhodococcus erythropolis]|uniref:hypothetical protein n=1 Tax=Rhodococcus erythropolis TaxID=1833 RepID=UPI0008D2E748|nr:hypothetical protein [Rhodococcus erythropolis]OFV78488.1 hypothetical protein RERY_09950 [Rhodococcus erythropolis]
MKATSTYECHVCNHIVNMGDEIFLVGGDLRCVKCSPPTTATQTVEVKVVIRVGDKVQFEESKRWWTVRAVSDDGNLAILTSPFNPQNTVLYTIIDNTRGVRGPDDRIFSSGYESDDDVNERMRELVAGEIAVSRRTSKFVPLDIANVVNA